MKTIASECRKRFSSGLTLLPWRAFFKNGEKIKNSSFTL